MKWDKYLQDGKKKGYGLFIDGEFSESYEDDKLQIKYAYTGDVWAEVPNGTQKDIDHAVKSARSAFNDGWGVSSPTQRADLLHGIADVIDEHAEELGELETLQTARPIRDQSSTLERLGDWYRYYAGWCDKIEGRTIPVENKDGNIFNYTLKEPLGVIGAITPWNMPLMLTTMKIAPALATGNTVVIKPSEFTPVGDLRLAELVYNNLDIPPGVINIVTGDGSTGSALTSHPDINKLTFTGSKQVGKEVGKEAGEKIIPSTLELGGKSPNIIFPSSDLNNAVTGAVKGMFIGSGQGCSAGTRILVHQDIYDEFMESFLDKSRDIKIGDPLDPETEMGPIANDRQYNKVCEYINIGKSEGANLILGGISEDNLDNKNLIRATVFTNVENDMKIAQDEIFGPVASVIQFENEEQAIQIANDTEYGLVAGVWTGNIAQAHRMAKKLKAGRIFINEYRRGSYMSPQGGYKKSGLGRENGEEGLNEYLQTKSVWVDLAGEITDPFKLG